MSLKKSDNVVFNNETGLYDASLKGYATNIGAPVITTVDTVSWKNRNLQVVNAQFKATYDELKSMLDDFKENFQYNTRVYNAKFNFEPIVGKTYHLYKNKLNEDFLSILSPKECNFNFIASFTLNSDKVWIKTNEI